MTDLGASPGEMPKTPVPDRAGAELDEQLLDAILGGQHLPADAPEQAYVVAEMLASLAGPAEPGDLAAETAVRSAFARAVPPAARPGPADVTQPARHRPAEAPAPRRRRSFWPPARLSAQLAAALSVVVIMLGGAVAAYAGVLPGPIQNLAHRTIGAPAAHIRPAGQSLCVAYARAEARHDAQALSGAYERLAQAAGGASHVIPFCIAAGESEMMTPRSSGRPASSPPTSKTAGSHGKAKGHAKTKGHRGRGKAKGRSKPKSGGKAKGHSKGKSQGKAKGHGKAHKPHRPHKPHKPHKQHKAHKPHKSHKAKHHKAKHHGQAKGHHKHMKPKQARKQKA